jgi:hypothetical protein
MNVIQDLIRDRGTKGNGYFIFEGKRTTLTLADRLSYCCITRKRKEYLRNVKSSDTSKNRHFFQICFLSLPHE